MGISQVDYYKAISQRLDQYMRNQAIANDELVERCKKNGDSISAASVQRIRSFHGNSGIKSISVYHIWIICKALHIEARMLLDPYTTVTSDGTGDRENIIADVNRPEFQRYLGTYNAYFFPTKVSERNMLYGKLELAKSQFGQCQAEFTIFTKSVLKGKEENSQKVYTGRMVISLNMSACYVILENHQIGEISFLSFRYMYTNEHDMSCRIALALTTSAGENRRPTVHRMLLTRRELSSEELSLLRSQLLMNTDKIMIERKALEDIMAGLNCSEEEKRRFLTAISPIQYCMFDEALINELQINDETRTKLICQIRNASTAARYNKVSGKADAVLYSFVSGTQNS